MNVTLTMKEYEELQSYKTRFLKSRIKDSHVALGVCLMNSTMNIDRINNQLKQYGLGIRIQNISQDIDRLPEVYIINL